MKAKMLFLFGSLLLLSGVANAQFNAFIDYYCFQEVPLTIACDFTGPTIPDGTTVQIFWDQNNNGPDALDVQPCVGGAFGCANFNSFPMNGADMACEGGFFTTDNFTIPTNTPQPSRYWVRICVPGENRYWRTDSFTIVDGYNEIDIHQAEWVCVEEACGGCITPDPVTGFAASDTSCTQVYMSWSAYPADQEVDSLFIYRTTIDTLVTKVHRTATNYSYTGAPSGTRNYLIVARSIQGSDTCESTASQDNGTKNPGALGPATCAATDNRCGSVIVSWTVPGSIATIDSFNVYRNGVLVGRTGPGTAGQPQSDTIFVAGAANYTVSGWNIECGAGTQSSADAGTAFEAPTAPTNVTATVGECTITVNWTPVAGANSYEVYRDGATLIGTVPAPPLTGHEPPSAQTNYTFTVVASATGNPVGCQDSPPSLGAIGSDIDAPTAPTTVAASDSLFCTHVLVTWADNSSTETGFIIVRSSVNIDTVNAGVTTFNDSTAVPGTTYNYTVLAYNACGNSSTPTTNPGSKKQAPPTVTITSATDNLPDRVTVTWVNTIRETGYRVLRNGTSLATVGADVVTYDDLTAVGGLVYAYSVLAFGECGDGDTSAVDSGRVMASLNAPTNVVASDTNCTFVRVTWTDNNTAPSETGHAILRDDVQIGTVGVNVTTYDDNTAVRGVVYAYKVQATGPGGPATSTAENGQLAPLPGTPTLSVDSVTCANIHFAWTSGANADTFLLFRDGAQIAAIPVVGGANGTTVSTPPDGLEHTYYAICGNECGRGDTSAVVVAARESVPGAVSDLTGTSTDCSTIQIMWTSPPGATNLQAFVNGVSQGSISASLSELTIPVGNGPFTWDIYMIAENECGQGAESNHINVAVEQSPTTPQNVAASDTSCDFVYVIWDAADGDVDGYDIYRGGELAGSVGGDVLQFLDSPGNSDVNSYMVVATSATCDESSPSIPVNGRTLEAVGVPVDFDQTGSGCASMTLCWDDAVGDVDGYIVYLDGDSVGSVDNETLCFEYFGSAGTYSATVAAYSLICGVGSQSAAITATIYAQPITPPNFTASDNSCAAVTLTWGAPAEPNAVAGYRIYREANLIYEGAAYNDSRTYVDAGAAFGVNNYSIVAYSTLDDCDDSPAAVAVGELLPYPTAPTNVVATDTSCSDVLVSWTAATGTFDSYIIYRNGTAIDTITGDLTEFTDTSLEGGLTAAYTVSAYDDVCGESAQSAPDNGTRLEGPEPPTNVAATDDDCDEIVVTWSVAPGDVTEYRVYRDGTLAGTVSFETLTFTDTPAAGVYQYSVRAYSTFCGETNSSVADQGERLPQMGQLTMVSASVDSCNGILVTWDAYPGATLYRIYRNDNPNILVEVAAPGTSYFDATPAQGVQHSYYGTAVNDCNEGPTSNEVFGQRAQTPGQVTGLTATQNLVNQVCLEWTDLAGELSYLIYRDAVLIATNSADDVTYCDGGATPGQQHSYTVEATNVCGSGQASAAVIGLAVFSLAQVQDFVATTDDCDQICMSWTDIENETGYEILRESVPFDTVAANVTTYCDPTPEPGACFNYSVRAFNVGGNGPVSAVNGGCRRDVPSDMQGLTATTDNCSAVFLTWFDSDDDEGYVVIRNGATLGQTGMNDTTYEDVTATPGVIYEYNVWPDNFCGVNFSGPTVQGAIADVPPVVTGVAATVDQCSTITVSWADQALEAGYRIYRDGNLATPIATVGQNVTSYVNTNTTGNHSYQVRAFNACGDGLVSAAANGTGFAVPGVATGVVAVENCGDVTITWTPPATSPITEYRILRNNVQVGAVLHPATSYQDLNLPAGSYSYKIVTANQCGAGSASSPSNSVTVIPALEQVSNFQAAPSNCFCITLSWSNVQNESGYYIYCDGVIVDTVGANVTSATICPADTQACVVQVTAYNGCETGPLSTGINVTPNTYPVAVAGFTASENMCDRVRMQWQPYNAPGVNYFRISRNDQTLAVIPASAVQYDHLGVWPLSTYQIRALRVCSPGDTISMLSADQGRTSPTPVAPHHVTASDNGCGIVTVVFMFANVDGQDSVFVKRNSTIIGRLAGGAANVERSFVDTDPLGQAANYEVCASSNICGEGDCLGDPGAAAPVAGTVTDLEATNDRCTTIILTWTGTPYATAYVVRVNGGFLANVPQGTFSYTHEVTTGVTNSYTVAATNDCGSGPQTPPVSGSTIPLPPVPSGVAASDGLCNIVIVSWNEIAVATSYQVWRNNVLLAEIPGGVEFYNDNDVLPGVTYNYQVRGVNQCGLGALSPVTTGFSAQQVATVTNLVATTALNDRVRLTWNNVAQETGFEILRGFPAEVIATVGIDETEYDDFSAAPGVEYEYRVRAFNGCGTGQASAIAYGYRVPVDPILFGVVTVATDLFGCMSAVPADVDDDGDMDVVAAGMFADKIVWYENNGSWGFTAHDLETNWDGARSVAAGDIDDDGDIDIAAVAQFADQLVWYRQNANGSFTRFVIASNYDGARDVLIVNLDGDGDKDLVTVACDANDVSWWRNNGSETFTRQIIDNNFVGARSIEVADIGNDGDLDVLGAAYEGGMLAWYSNNGSEVFTRNVLMTEAFGASYINAAHLNTDNVLDIYFCVAQEPLIAWWDGATMEQNYVTSLLPFPRELDAVDMDNDERADLLVAANEPNEISWWRNTDNRFYRNVMTNTLTQASVVHGVDFENDGDTDVLGAGEGTIKIWLSALEDEVQASDLILPDEDDGSDEPTLGHVSIPLVHELSANYPNPFNPQTQIRFGLPQAEHVTLTVYDITGREVARLVSGSFSAGYHTVTFDASSLASGVYLYRIQAGSFVESRKMMLMK